MKGPDGARDQVALLLADVLPLKIPALRAVFGLDNAEQPDVDTITSGEKPDQALGTAGQTWVEVTIPRMNEAVVCDITPEGDQEFRVSYACRTYIWALGASWTDSIDRRDRSVNAVRTSLLEFPTLRLQGGDSGYRMEYQRWYEEYGVPVRPSNPSGRCWSTAMLAFDIITYETLAAGRLREPVGITERVALSLASYGMEPLPADTPVISDTGTAGDPPPPDEPPPPPPEPTGDEIVGEIITTVDPIPNTGG
jgi:hypothetical protein